MPNDPRKALERLCAERGEDFAGLSRLIGRNPAYIQQYIRRGTPKRLKEDERRTLARFFGVAESVLGGPAGLPADGMIAVSRRLAIAGASAPYWATRAIASSKAARPERKYSGMAAAITRQS